MSQKAVGLFALIGLLLGFVFLVLNQVFDKPAPSARSVRLNAGQMLSSMAAQEIQPESIEIKPQDLISHLPSNATVTPVELVDRLSHILLEVEEPETHTVLQKLSTVLLDVPFTPQAPFGEWQDPRQDYGCEETSLLMVTHALQSRPLSREAAREQIIAISDWEQENYGDFHDRSAADTVQLAQDYFGLANVRVQYDVTIEDIKLELSKGNPVIVPVNGRVLDNPFYTPPGPLQHMVVVKGFDDETEEFITNDPGTKNGESMRYSYSNLIQALRDYETGHNEPITELRKAMIVIDI